MRWLLACHRFEAPASAIQQGIDLEERNFFDPLDLSFPALGQMFAKEPEQRCTA